MCATKGCFYVGRFILALSPPFSDDVHRCPVRKKGRFSTGQTARQTIPIHSQSSQRNDINHQESMLIFADFTGLPISLIAGWWLTYPSEKYEFVSWDYYSQYGKSLNIFQTTNQMEKSQYTCQQCRVKYHMKS